MFKSELDRRREAVAREMGAGLEGYGITVVGGGKKGPYTVIVDSLSRTTAEAIIEAVKVILERGR